MFSYHMGEIADALTKEEGLASISSLGRHSLRLSKRLGLIFTVFVVEFKLSDIISVENAAQQIKNGREIRLLALVPRQRQIRRLGSKEPGP
jgi:hypothetical protein